MATLPQYIIGGYGGYTGQYAPIGEAKVTGYGGYSLTVHSSIGGYSDYISMVTTLL